MELLQNKQRIYIISSPTYHDHSIKNSMVLTPDTDYKTNVDITQNGNKKLKIFFSKRGNNKKHAENSMNARMFEQLDR